MSFAMRSNADGRPLARALIAGALVIGIVALCAIPALADDDDEDGDVGATGSTSTTTTATTIRPRVLTTTTDHRR